MFPNNVVCSYHSNHTKNRHRRSTITQSGVIKSPFRLEAPQQFRPRGLFCVRRIYIFSPALKLPASTHACPARPSVPVSFFKNSPLHLGLKPRSLGSFSFSSPLSLTHHRAGFGKPQSSIALTDTTAKQDREKLRDISCWSRRTSHIGMCA